MSRIDQIGVGKLRVKGVNSTKVDFIFFVSLPDVPIYTYIIISFQHKIKIFRNNMGIFKFTFTHCKEFYIN